MNETSVIAIMKIKAFKKFSHNFTLPDRCLIGLVRVERRIETDQVYRLGVESAEEVKVIAFKDGSVFDVHYLSDMTSHILRNQPTTSKSTTRIS